MPSTTDAARVWSIITNSPVSTAVQTTTWAMPKPKISLRIARSRSHDSSSPIMNRRKATPSSARTSIWERSVMLR